jgi:branched-chain amino acid transport system ATP-binding protein
MADVLVLEGVSAAYGKIAALHEVSIRVPQGQIVALLGSNGAGKSTTLSVVSGLVKATKGVVKLEGAAISHLGSDAIVGLGVVQVPEGREVFREMTVLENLELGAYCRRDAQAVRRDLEVILGYFPRLSERLAQSAATLSGGEQQMLAIGRALMAKPRILLLDEPSMGLSPLLVQQIFSILRRLNRGGLTMLLVEQSASLALAVSDYAYVLVNGAVALEGPSRKLLNDERVQSTYFGT